VRWRSPRKKESLIGAAPDFLLFLELRKIISPVVLPR